MLGLAHAAAVELGQAGPCLSLIRTLHSCATAGGPDAQGEPGAAAELLSAAYKLVGHVKGMGEQGPQQELHELEQKVSGDASMRLE